MEGNLFENCIKLEQINHIKEEIDENYEYKTAEILNKIEIKEEILEPKLENHEYDIKIEYSDCDIKFEDCDLVKSEINSNELSNYTCKICTKNLAWNSSQLLVEEDPLKCEFCCATFESREDLLTHTKFHTEECKVCHRKFSWIPIMDHTGEKPYTYTVCMVPESRNLNKDRTDMVSLLCICSLCKKPFTKHMKKPKEVQLEHEAVKKIHLCPTCKKLKHFKCELCDKSFAKLAALNLHLKTHRAEDRLRCEFCGKTFKEKCKLESHLRSHTEILGENSYACPGCEKTFTHLNRLNRHMKVHLKKTFECPTCCKCFSSKWKIRAHIQTHSGEEPSSKSFKCELCDKSLKTKESLKYHIETHTDTNVEPSGSFENAMIEMMDLANEDEAVVDDILANQNDLDYWNFIKQGNNENSSEDSDSRENDDINQSKYFGQDETKIIDKYIIEVNNFKDASGNDYKIYWLINDTGTVIVDENVAESSTQEMPENVFEIIYKCKICQVYTAKQKNTMRQHVTNMHRKDILKCPECFFHTLYKSNLKQHMLKHKKLKGIEQCLCDICGYSTYRKDTFRNHLLTHDQNAERLKCDLCNYTTLRMQNLNCHKITAHKLKSEKKIIKCSYCAFSNPRRFMVTRHENEVHKKIKMKCSLCSFEAPNKYKLRNHLNSVHDVTTEAKRQCFECDRCKYYTYRSDLFEKHQKMDHDENRRN